MLRVTESLVHRGSVAVDPATPGAVEGKAGRYYSIYGIGKSVANVPSYLVAKLFSRISSRYPKEYLAHFFISLINPVATGLLCAELFRFCGHFGLVARIPVAGRNLRPGDDRLPVCEDDMSEPLASLWRDGIRLCIDLRPEWRHQVGGAGGAGPSFGVASAHAVPRLLHARPRRAYLIAKWLRKGPAPGPGLRGTCSSTWRSWPPWQSRWRSTTIRVSALSPRRGTTGPAAGWRGSRSSRRGSSTTRRHF